MTSLVATAGYVYTGQAIAFSLCILMIGPFDWHKRMWLISNVFGVVGVFLATTTSPDGNAYGLYSAFAVLIAGCLKALALGDGRLLSARNRWCVAMLVLAVAVITIAGTLPDQFRLLAIATSSVLSMLGNICRLMGSRRWRGSWAYYLMIATVTCSAWAMSTRIIQAYPFGDQTTFFGNSAIQTASILGVIVVSFFMQIAFIGLLAARQSRIRVLAERRSVRAAERARVMRAAKAETDRLSEERLGFLKMLTHEVRQPMNNAQAALQAIIMQISSATSKPTKVREAARKTQNVLDGIVLTLTNAIAGATLIERGQGASLQRVDAIDICHLAILDCQLSDQGRISFVRDEPHLFLDCDPVLMRLSLRNLLDNAIKYSPRGSAILFRAAVDDQEFGARFTVSNELADTLSLHGNIFERGKRAVDKVYEGFGVGLFIVNETARVHFGRLTYYQKNVSEVTFDLFIPI